jgi:hypothetical protein
MMNISDGSLRRKVGSPRVGVIIALVDTITDKFGATYMVTSARLGAGAMVYHVHAGQLLVARAVLQIYKDCISDVLVYRQADRRRGICSALYAAIETDIGRPLVPSRIKSKDGKAFWASRH